MDNEVKRITRRIGESIDFVDGKDYANLSHEESTKLLFQRLAEYEDTDLTPQEIKKLQEFNIHLLEKLEDYEWKYGSVDRAMFYAELQGKC